MRVKLCCYDLKQSSKVNLSVYFLPAVGWEKVIKIRRFSNETAIVDLFVNFTDCNQNRRSRHKIVEIPSFTPAIVGGERYFIN
ncbi:MAG: hypothetical protein LBR79_06910 [Oscillospiraceae bacterium]|nr:hypothetical protein [Oscillospiraceae bacterium]